MLLMYYVHVLLSLTISFPFLSKFASLIKVCGQNEWTLLFKNPPVVLFEHLCPTWRDANANELQSTGTSCSVLSKETAFEYLKDCLGFCLVYLERERESDWNGDREKIKNVLAAGCNCQLQFGCLHVDSQHSHNKDEARQQRHLPRNNSILYLFVN